MSENGECQAVHALLVEDDPGDVLMTREAFEQHKLRNVLHVVTDGEQALRFLRSYALHANAYVSKPVDFERFMEVIREIDNFFVTVVRLAP